MKSIRCALAGLAVVGLTSGCTTTITPVPVRQTSTFVPLAAETVYSIRHLPETGDLTVILRTGEVVEFHGVPALVVAEWKSAPDPDAFYRQHILGVKESESEGKAQKP
jgi:hypothetical protein